jgi:hypothetical protein
VDMLLNSSMHKNGAKVYRDGGFVNYLQNNGGYYAQGGVIGGGLSMDGSLSESRAITQRSLEVMDNMKTANDETAQGIKALLALFQPTNGLLANIRDKPSGISLHDLNNAFTAQSVASKKSDM